MKFYKHLVNEEILAYVSSPKDCVDKDFIEISQDEYETAMAALEEKTKLELEAAEQAQTDYISELEAENAALLYQVLTGEELADV